MGLCAMVVFWGRKDINLFYLLYITSYIFRKKKVNAALCIKEMRSKKKRKNILLKIIKKKKCMERKATI